MRSSPPRHGAVTITQVIDLQGRFDAQNLGNPRRTAEFRGLDAPRHGLPTKFSTDRVDQLRSLFADRHGAAGKPFRCRHNPRLSAPARVCRAPGPPTPRKKHPNIEGNDLLKIVQEAGWPIWPLILCSVGALAL